MIPGVLACGSLSHRPLQTAGGGRIAIWVDGFEHRRGVCVLMFGRASHPPTNSGPPKHMSRQTEGALLPVPLPHRFSVGASVPPPPPRRLLANPRERGKRCLRLECTDGQWRVPCLEYRPCPSLDYAQVRWGGGWGMGRPFKGRPHIAEEIHPPCGVLAVGMSENIYSPPMACRPKNRCVGSVTQSIRKMGSHSTVRQNNAAVSLKKSYFSEGEFFFLGCSFLFFYFIFHSET